MGCTVEAIENKKPLLPAEWESFKKYQGKGAHLKLKTCTGTYTASRSILADH